MNPKGNCLKLAFYLDRFFDKNTNKSLGTTPHDISSYFYFRIQQMPKQVFPAAVLSMQFHGKHVRPNLCFFAGLVKE